MKFVLFSVSDNGENELSDEGADGGNPQKFLGWETPLLCTVIFFATVQFR